jgi:predicted DNA-binding transcriptional regulator AlpA
MKLIDKAGLKAKGLDLDDTTIWRKTKSGEFPKHVIVGNKRAWIESEIDAYIESLVAKRDGSIHGDDTDVDERNPVGDGLHAAAPDKRKTAKTDAAAEVA